MKIFKISCLSDCGSYFTQYLQSVTIIAETKEQALDYIKDYEFIYPQNKWEIEELCSEIKSPMVIDTDYDSDY